MTEKPSDGGLRLTQERLRLAEETAGIGAFDLDLTSDSWVTTPHVAVLFGFAPYVTKPALVEWERAIFVDDRLKLRSAIARAREDGVLSAEFRVTHPDGSVHWLVAKGQAARDSAGVVRWLRGTCFDITERKVLEVRLLALGEALEASCPRTNPGAGGQQCPAARERTAVPPAGRGRDRLCDLHARSRGEGRQLEPGRGTPQGLYQRGNPRPALLPLLHRGGQAERTSLLSSSARPSRPGSTRARAGVSERTAAGSGRASSCMRSATRTGSWLALPR